MIETVQHQPDPVILITINLITIQNDFFFYVELSINVEKKLNKYQFPIFPLEEMENKNEKKIAFCLFVFFFLFFLPAATEIKGRHCFRPHSAAFDWSAVVEKRTRPPTSFRLVLYLVDVVDLFFCF